MPSTMTLTLNQSTDVRPVRCSIAGIRVTEEDMAKDLILSLSSFVTYTSNNYNSETSTPSVLLDKKNECLSLLSVVAGMSEKEGSRVDLTQVRKAVLELTNPLRGTNNEGRATAVFPEPYEITLEAFQSALCTASGRESVLETLRMIGGYNLSAKALEELRVGGEKKFETIFDEWAVDGVGSEYTRATSTLEDVGHEDG